MYVVVIELTRLSRLKMRSKILSLRVGSLTCWLRISNTARYINVPAIGQLVVEHDEPMFGKLKSSDDVGKGKGQRHYMRFCYQNNVIKLCGRTSGRVVH